MNIYDIAKEAGVSSATVSRVLNNSPRVSSKTREKIQKIISAQQYVPNIVARNLSVGETSNIAFVVPDIENPFFGHLLHGISNRASESSYNVFMFNTDENVDREHQALRALRAQNIKGLLIDLAMADDPETIEMLGAFEKNGVPVVLLDRDVEKGEFDGVFSDDVTGAYNAVNALIDAGHRKIATISGPERMMPGYRRLEGYRKAMKEHGISIPADYVQNGDFRPERAYQCMKVLMELKNPPTAVFTGNNLTSMGVLHYLKDHGMKLVRDISMVGFDDIDILDYTDIQLSVVARPVYEMGYEAMVLLEDRFRKIREGDQAAVVMRKNTVKTQLILRGSEKMPDQPAKKRNTN